MKHEANVHELFSKKKVVNLLNEGIAKKKHFHCRTCPKINYQGPYASLVQDPSTYSLTQRNYFIKTNGLWLEFRDLYRAEEMNFG